MALTPRRSYLKLLFVIVLHLTHQARAQNVGGWNALDPTSASAMSAAQTALELYPDSNTWGYPQHLIEVLEAKSQVVAGVYYELLVKVGVGACSRPEGAQHFNNYDQDCYFEKVGTCKFKVFIQIFTDTKNLDNSSCSEFETAWNGVPLNDRVVEESTAVSLRRLTQDGSNTAQLYRVDQAVQNALTPNVYKIYSRISFNCTKCKKESASRVLFTIKTDSKRHVMTRCEVDSSVVAESSVCVVIPAFPY